MIKRDKGISDTSFFFFSFFFSLINQIMGRVEGDKVAFDKMVDCGIVKRNYKVGEGRV